MRCVSFYEFPVGLMGIAEEGGAICRVFFGVERSLLGFETVETPLIHETATQLTAYFRGERTGFNLPLELHGTAFQQSVWSALRTIPHGEVRSYKEITELIGKPKACRAVGMANHNNPIAIIVPCHRVVGHNGALTGYAGGLSVKKHLLDLEKPHASTP